MGADSETPHHRCKRATCGVVPNKEHVAVTLKLVDLERLVSGREGRAIMATEWSKCVYEDIQDSAAVHIK